MDKSFGEHISERNPVPPTSEKFSLSEFTKSTKQKVEGPSHEIHTISENLTSGQIEDDSLLSQDFPLQSLHRYFRPIVQVTFWLLFTAYFNDCPHFAHSSWWICGLILHRDEWLIPFLLYLAFTLWVLFQYIPFSLISRFSFHLILLKAGP